MTRTGDQERLEALLRALRGVQEFAHIADGALEPMRVKGLVHEHIRIRGTGCILRVPHYSQFGLSPQDNLAYEAACFRRAAPGGTTPALFGILAPEPAFPWGALVVGEIEGRPPRLPGDLAAMAECLAAIHTLSLPDVKAPLLVHDDPLAGTLGVIRTQSEYLPHAGIPKESLRQLDDEIEWASRLGAAMDGRDQPVALVVTDTHPGNFLIEKSGRAVFVDLEKALYGSPAVDLAHASVYTSTMWDPDSEAALAPDDVTAFYNHYLATVPPRLGDALRPWLVPMRRLTWLRTTTWCARWRVEAGRRHAQGAERQPSGWAARHHDAAQIARVRARIDDYFDPETIAAIRAEWLGPRRLTL